MPSRPNGSFDVWSYGSGARSHARGAAHPLDFSGASRENRVVPAGNPRNFSSSVPLLWIRVDTALRS